MSIFCNPAIIFCVYRPDSPRKSVFYLHRVFASYVFLPYLAVWIPPVNEEKELSSSAEAFESLCIVMQMLGYYFPSDCMYIACECSSRYKRAKGRRILYKKTTKYAEKGAIKVQISTIKQTKNPPPDRWGTYGRGDANRTRNLRFWRPPLCQLSYSPLQMTTY